MQDLNITLVQGILHWEDPEANRGRFSDLLQGLRGTTDLVVLPEMFTTGFTMRSTELAEGMDGPTVRWMRGQARALDAALYGSAVIAEGGRLYNRGLFVMPDGRTATYDKRHLFRFANETDHYSPGRERTVVEWRGWRLLLQICFDLRFPVFARNRRGAGREDYDAALYVANWPEARRHAWNSLLVARAIENQCYVAGVNRTGTDGKGIPYVGDSAVIGPKGEVIASGRGEGLVPARLGRAELEDFRGKFPVSLESDDFELRP